MLVTFKSHASADVIMLGDAAKKLIAILGKDPLNAQGIVTAPQLPDAIARLKAAIEEDRARQAELERQRTEADEAADNGSRPHPGWLLRSGLPSAPGPC